MFENACLLTIKHEAENGITFIHISRLNDWGGKCYLLSNQLRDTISDQYSTCFQDGYNFLNIGRKQENDEDRPCSITRMNRIFYFQLPEKAVDVLRRCFATLGQKKDVHVLFACLRRQNLSAMLPLLDDAAGSVTLTTFDHEDARDEMGYALYVEDHAYIGNPLMALMQLEAEHPDETIVATGCPEFVAYLKQRL